MNKPPRMGKSSGSPNILFIGIGFGLFYWLIESLIEVLLFKEGSIWESILMPSSEQIWMRFFIIFLLTLFSFVVQNILNKRNEAEAALEESEERYRRLAAATNEGVAIHDGEKVIDVNESASRIFGFDASEIIGSSPLKFIDESSHQVLLDNIKSGYDKPYEVTAIRKDGSRFILEVNGQTISWKGREVRVTALRDVTNRKQDEAESDLTDTKYRVLFNNNNDPLFVFQIGRDGTIGRFVEANDIACKLFDCTRETLMDRSPEEFIANEEAEAFRQIISNLIDFKFSLFETEIINRGNRRMALEISAHLFEMEGDWTVIASARDLSERRKAEASIRERESRYRRLYENSPVAYTALEEDGSISEVSEKWLELLGYGRNEVIGKPFVDFLVEENRKYFSKLFIKARTAQSLHHIEIGLIRKSGEVINASLEGSIERDDLGGFQYAHCVFTDISTLKKAKAGIAGFEFGLKHLFENVAELVFTLDPSGNFIMVNRRFEEITGFESGTLKGQNISDYVHPDDAKFIAQAFAKCGEGEEIPPMEFRLRTQAGDLFSGEFMAAPLIQDERTMAIQVISKLAAVSAGKSDRNDLPAEPVDGARQDNMQVLLQSIPEAVCILDRDLSYLGGNKYFEAWLKRNNLPEVSLGDNFIAKHDTLFEELRRQYDSIDETDGVIEHRTQAEHDGNGIHFEAKLSLLCDDKQSEIILAVFRDIEQEDSDSNIENDYNLNYRALIDKTEYGLIESDRTGEIRYLNSRAGEIFRIDSEDYIGKHLDILFAGVVDEAENEITEGNNPLKQAVTNGESFKSIVIGLTEGRHYPLWLRLSIILPENVEDDSGILISFHDVSLFREHQRFTAIQKDLGISLLAETSPGEVLRVSTDAAMKASRMDGGGIYLFDNENEILNLECYKGLSQDFARKIQRYTSDSEEYRLVKVGESLIVDSGDDSAGTIEKIRKAGFKSLVSIPLKSGDEIIGCINLASRKVDRITKDSITAIEIIASQITNAINRTRVENELKESELRFRQMAENVEEVFWMSNFDLSRIIYASPSYEKVWGRKVEELYTNNTIWMKSIIPEDRERIEKSEGKVLSGEYDEIYRIERPDGSIRWIRDRAFPVKNDYGEICRVVGIAADVTESKEAEEALLKERDYSEGIVKTAQAAIMVIDPDGKIMSLNPYTEEITGYGSDQMIGEDWFERFVEESYRENSQKRFQMTLDDIKITRDENAIVNNEGIEIDLEWHLRSLKDSDDNIIGVLAIGQDITERKKNSAALAESEARFRSLFSNLQTGVAIFDKNEADNKYRFKDINSAGETILRINRDDVIGAAIDDVLRSDGTETLLDAINNTAETGGTEFVSSTLRNDNNSIQWLDSYVCRIPSGEIVMAFDDITERKLSEIKLHYQAELLENVSDAIISTDISFQIKSWNLGAEQIFGWHRNEALGKDINELIKTDFGDGSLKKTTKILHKKGSWYGELIQMDKNGDRHNTLASVTTLTDRQGNIRGFIFVNRDITYKKISEEKLHASEQRLRAIFDNAAVGIGMINREGYWTQVNNHLLQILGYSQDELCQKTSLDITPEEDHEFSLVQSQKIFDGEAENVRYEKRYYTSEGKIVWVEISASPIINQSGEIEASLAVITNITDRKLAGDKLRASEERLRLAVQNVPVMIDAFDENMNIIVWNKECERVTGYTADEMIGNPQALERLYPDEQYRRKLMANWIEERIGDFRNLEMELICKNGDRKIISWANVSKEHPIPGWYTWGIGIDITNRKLTEEALLESEERFRSMVESSIDGIILADEAGTIVEYNSGQERICGIPREEAIGMPVWEFHHQTFQDSDKNESVLEFLKSSTEEILKSGQSNFLNKFQEHEIVTADGKKRIIQSLPFTIKSDIGHKICTISRDITETRINEKEHFKAQKLESVGLLAGGIAHDFNNILTSIIGNISLAKMDVDPKYDLYLRLEEAEKASERAQDLTAQLLTFSRGGAPVKKSASINQIIEDSAQFVLRGSNIKAEYNLSNDLKPVIVDTGQISQVINNLIINAMQAMPDGGIIEVFSENVPLDDNNRQALKAGEYAKIQIRDNGVGISRENLRKIFDPYFTTKKQGNGLGLATTYSIIKNHDGHIGVESEPGKGTAFTIHLPTAGTIQDESREPGTVSIRGAGRILVMDDEEPIRNITGLALEKSGYEVECVVDGQEAIEKYREAFESGNKFDAIIMDLTVPGGMGGKEAFDRIRQIDPEVKAIVSSGYTNNPIMGNYIEHGFTARIVKPYKADILSQTVLTAIEGPKAGSPKS